MTGLYAVAAETCFQLASSSYCVCNAERLQFLSIVSNTSKNLLHIANVRKTSDTYAAAKSKQHFQIRFVCREFILISDTQLLLKVTVSFSQCRGTQAN